MHMSKIKLIFAATALCAGLMATAASAMPITPVPADPAGQIEQVRWICGPYGRCWWRPNYYAGYYGYGYYPARRYAYRPYYYGGYRHW